MEKITVREPEIISSLLINGDLGKLNPAQKVEYYKLFCERIGLDPLTQPFKILKLNGKEVLYCDRSGAAQLNKKHGVSHEIRTRETTNDLYVVTCRASIGSRFTDSIGAVSVAGLKGDSLANAMMKGETKAKRRATLDLLGLGILDETETETIPGSQTVDVPYTSEDLQDQYMALLVELDQYWGAEKVEKLIPKNWKKKEVNNETLLDAIKFVKEKLEEERIIQKQNRTPHGMLEINEAARRAADQDDFYERNK